MEKEVGRARGEGEDKARILTLARGGEIACLLQLIRLKIFYDENDDRSWLFFQFIQIHIAGSPPTRCRVVDRLLSFLPSLLTNRTSGSRSS